MHKYAPVTLLMALVASGATAYMLDTGLGTVNVERVYFSSGGHTSAGTLYTPSTADGGLPAVVLAHGISNPGRSCRVLPWRWPEEASLR